MNESEEMLSAVPYIKYAEKNSYDDFSDLAESIFNGKGLPEKYIKIAKEAEEYSRNGLNDEKKANDEKLEKILSVIKSMPQEKISEIFDNADTEEKNVSESVKNGEFNKKCMEYIKGIVKNGS